MSIGFNVAMDNSTKLHDQESSVETEMYQFIYDTNYTETLSGRCRLACFSCRKKKSKCLRRSIESACDNCLERKLSCENIPRHRKYKSAKQTQTAMEQCSNGRYAEFTAHSPERNAILQFERTQEKSPQRTSTSLQPPNVTDARNFENQLSVMTERVEMARHLQFECDPSVRNQEFSDQIQCELDTRVQQQQTAPQTPHPGYANEYAYWTFDSFVFFDNAQVPALEQIAAQGQRTGGEKFVLNDMWSSLESPIDSTSSCPDSVQLRLTADNLEAEAGVLRMLASQLASAGNRFEMSSATNPCNN